VNESTPIHHISYRKKNIGFVGCASVSSAAAAGRGGSPFPGGERRSVVSAGAERWGGGQRARRHRMALRRGRTRSRCGDGRATVDRARGIRCCSRPWPGRGHGLGLGPPQEEGATLPHCSLLTCRPHARYNPVALLVEITWPSVPCAEQPTTTTPPRRPDSRRRRLFFVTLSHYYTHSHTHSVVLPPRRPSTQTISLHHYNNNNIIMVTHTLRTIYFS